MLMISYKIICWKNDTQSYWPNSVPAPEPRSNHRVFCQSLLHGEIKALDVHLQIIAEVLIPGSHPHDEVPAVKARSKHV